jgi:predicted membrane protein
MHDNISGEQRRELRRQRRQNCRDQWQGNRSGSVLAGLVILGVGTVFLLKEMNVGLPGWLFTWPMILVAFGLLVGAGNRFRDPGWLFISGIGVVFLMRKIWPEIPVWNYTWPVVIIIIGLIMILSPRRKRSGKYEYHYKWNDGNQQEEVSKKEGTETQEGIIDRDVIPEKTTRTWGSDSDNWVDVVSIFSNIKRQVYTKNFKGGDIVSIFGGAEINLTQADFTGPIRMEMVQIFGGTKLIIPPHWEIRSEMTAIFGGIEDKRPPQTQYDADKVVILNGTTLFGGIEIKSY